MEALLSGGFTFWEKDVEGGRRVIYSNRKITSQSECADVQIQPDGGVERRLCGVGKHLLEEVTDELLQVLEEHRGWWAQRKQRPESRNAYL